MADPSAIERIDNLRVIGRSSDAERMIELRNSAESSSVELRADIQVYTNAELQGVALRWIERALRDLGN